MTAATSVLTCSGCLHSLAEHDEDDGQCLHTEEAALGGGDCGCAHFYVKRLPIRGVRLNANYCLVKLTYLQAQMLFLAADHMTDDARENALHNIGWSGKEAKAFREAIDKLRETSERWPAGMDV